MRYSWDTSRAVASARRRARAARREKRDEWLFGAFCAVVMVYGLGVLWAWW